MHDVHARVRDWMEAAGLSVRVDAAGNIRGVYDGDRPDARRLYIGSHLDTVPNAGAFDGILGVIAAIAIVNRLRGKRLPFAIEVVGFSEEEGVRFGVPFIGSRAFVGTADEALLARVDRNSIRVDDAIRAFGLDPAEIANARAAEDAVGFLEIHIEQGPVLERLGYPVAVVEGIVGQSRLDVTFTGAANHAGTTPMECRRDGAAGAAAWILAVEALATKTPGLLATVGRIDTVPGATNVIAGECKASLDVRHADDATRRQAVGGLLREAESIAQSRGLSVASTVRLDQDAVAMDEVFVRALERATVRAGAPAHVMSSGAGHDAMIVRAKMPAAMLFVRSPGGISHHPDEAVSEQDVAIALDVASAFVHELGAEMIS